MPEEITELISNARKELRAARWIGDEKAEQVWTRAMDLFLDSYKECLDRNQLGQVEQDLGDRVQR